MGVGGGYLVVQCFDKDVGPEYGGSRSEAWQNLLDVFGTAEGRVLAPRLMRSGEHDDDSACGDLLAQRCARSSVVRGVRTVNGDR